MLSECHVDHKCATTIKRPDEEGEASECEQMCYYQDLRELRHHLHDQLAIVFRIKIHVDERGGSNVRDGPSQGPRIRLM